MFSEIYNYTDEAPVIVAIAVSSNGRGGSLVLLVRVIC